MLVIRKHLLSIAAIDIIVTIISVIAVVYLKLSAGLFAIGAISIALCTFFGFLLIEVRSNSEIKFSSESFRIAITSSVIVVYLYVVGLTIFFRSWSENIQPLTQTMITNFTTIVGVVIAFYFTSSAIIEKGSKRNQNIQS